VEFETLLYEARDGVVTITLNRPERYNAFNLKMATELRRAWEAVKADPEVVCVIVTGAGDKALCTGMDLAEAAAGVPGKRPTSREEMPFLHMTAIQNKCWKPVITAVNGMVVGGGLHFVCDADLIVAAEHATFADTHVRVGLIAGLEPVGLARRLPLEAALRLALLGGAERMGAQQALALGLVGEIVPLDRLMPRARELAAKICQNSPTAMARSKQCIWESLDVGLDDALEETWKVIEAHTGHPDSLEGPRAFVEKRRPRWAPYTGA
jgi:enoyl-CoA hydratase/carnithine racemase